MIRMRWGCVSAGGREVLGDMEPMFALPLGAGSSTRAQAACSGQCGFAGALGTCRLQAAFEQFALQRRQLGLLCLEAPDVRLNLGAALAQQPGQGFPACGLMDAVQAVQLVQPKAQSQRLRSEEHTSELQSPCNLVCRLL